MVLLRLGFEMCRVASIISLKLWLDMCRAMSSCDVGTWSSCRFIKRGKAKERKNVKSIMALAGVRARQRESEWNADERWWTELSPLTTGFVTHERPFHGVRPSIRCRWLRQSWSTTTSHLSQMTHTEKNKPIKQTVTKWRHFLKKGKNHDTFSFLFRKEK